MNPRYRRLVTLGGLCVFLVVVALALYQSPPRLSELRAGWLLVAALASAAAILLQTVQTWVFMRRERLGLGWRWSAWFTSEKAWMNSILPAKVGTAGAVMLLRQHYGVPWDKYLRFMLLCAGLTASASAAGAVWILWADWRGFGAALLVHSASSLLISLSYRVDKSTLALLSLLSLCSLAALGAGIGACIKGLGYSADFGGIAPVGVTLNLISIAAVTPGNFGFREFVLSLLAPAIPLTFAVVIQASTCYVFIRLLVSLTIASLLRGRLLLQAR